jgi:ubiquinone biosynthesis protein
VILLESVLVVTLVAVVLGWVGGRLLGGPHSRLRSVVSGAVGLFLGIVLAWLLTASKTRQWPPPLAAAVGTVLMTMLTLAVWEFLFPAGTMVLFRLPHPVRAARRRLARTRRYAEVVLIAARHGLGPHLGRQGREAATAVRLRPALEEAGGVFIKLGQFLSTRPDLLPPLVVAELAQLQDGVAPAPLDQVRLLLTRELGRPPEEVFVDFEPTPIAAASIAQAHRARLRSGEEVVVKVQRPGMEALIDRDLDILLQLARTAEARSSLAREYRVLDLAAGFAASLAEELDFRVEAQNIAAVEAALGADSGVVVPAVHRELSTSRVLTLQRLDGVSGREAGATAERLGLDRTALARQLLRSFVHQIMGDGVFHADPHPGNVLLLDDGRLALLDFGSVGRLNSIQIQALRSMMLAVQLRDSGLLRDAVGELAQSAVDVDEELLERALADFMAQRLGTGSRPSADMFRDLFRLLFEFRITFSPAVAAVFRCLVTLEGTLTTLAPGFLIVDEMRELGMGWLIGRISPADLRRTAQDELLAALPALRRLPRRLERVGAALEHGRLGANVRLALDARQERLLVGLVQVAILAFVGAALGLISALLLARATPGPLVFGSAHLYDVLGFAGLSASAVLILRALFGIARPGRN